MGPITLTRRGLLVMPGGGGGGVLVPSCDFNQDRKGHSPDHL